MQKESLKYTEDHEWVHLDNTTATIGISQYAIEELGEIVFVELPEINTSINQKNEFGTIESVKTVSSIYAPLSGKITDINTTLAEQPDHINADPYDKGWLIKLSINNSEEYNELMTFDQYQLFLKTLVH